MNVEDRAQLMIEEIPNQKPWEGKEELKAKFAKHLRDQIEECANIVAGEASLCSKGDEAGHVKAGYIGLHDAWLRIRALAAPGENNQEKGD